MFARLSLRFRIFLFFCLLAAAAAALAGGALYLGWSRAGETTPALPFVTAFVVFVFPNTGLAVAIWLLFDEHVAKPIDKLATDLRLRAHSGLEGPIDAESARYLGDLAPAVSAVSGALSKTVMDTAARVAEETQRLKTDGERLVSLLTEIPVATILLNPSQEIVLYDGQAATVLSQIAPPRLKAPISDYFDMLPFSEALERLKTSTTDVAFELPDITRAHRFDARLKVLGSDCHMLLIDPKAAAKQPLGSRPLVFDFGLIDTDETIEINATALRDICCVVFDTETTGLSVEKDAIVQLGAVRILNGRIVTGEAVNTYVDPGRAIPPASTRIHRITDADVSGAPDIGTAGRAFHHFARDAVLVAHNAPFDIGLLRRFQSEMGVEWNHPVLDTVLLSAVVFGTTETHSLDALCDRLSITIPAHARHTALGDAQATAEAYVKLIHLLEGKGIRTFGEVVEETRRHGRLLHDLNTRR
ncbi:MAG: 3'-5' exonuclease [Pseudomonadota bacterium]